MDSESTSQRRKPRLNAITKAERRERIFAQRKLGWPTDMIAQFEGLTPRRVRQIVSDILKRQKADDPTDFALLQFARLEHVLMVAAEAVDSGDIRAIDPLIKVLERIDHYRKAGARHQVFDDAARKALFDKLNRVANRFRSSAATAPLEASTPPENTGPAADGAPPAAQNEPFPFATNIQSDP